MTADDMLMIMTRYVYGKGTQNIHDYKVFFQIPIITSTFLAVQRPSVPPFIHDAKEMKMKR